MLGIPPIRVFGMLTSDELEVQQGEWARWPIPASAIRRVRRDSEPSSHPSVSSEDGAEPRVAVDEALGGGEENIQMIEVPSGESAIKSTKSGDRRVVSTQRSAVR